MTAKKSFRVSIRDIAQAAGISNAAASYALQNKPEVSSATREKVRQIARQLGYVPDARISSWMARVQDARKKDLLPIAWLNMHAEKDAWQKYKYLSPYQEGAQQRSHQLGFKLEEFWGRQPGMTMRRISQILYQQGIEGVIVFHHTRHFRLKWEYLAGVSIEGTILAPNLHRITTDFFYNFLSAIKMLERVGYRRIGVCLAETLDHRTRNGIGAMTHYLEVLHPKLKPPPPLFFKESHGMDLLPFKRRVVAWVRRHHPDVIVCHTSWMVECLEQAGLRVPQDIGVVHLATDDDVGDWAGICANKRAIGSAAVNWIVSSIQSRQFGVPETPMNMTIKGTWRSGRTLLVPKPQ